MPDIDYNQYPTIRRTCNQYGCGGRMRDTGLVYDSYFEHNIYRCVKCGHKAPWISNPVLNGSIGQLHLSSKTKSYSGLSMRSDPRFYPPKGE